MGINITLAGHGSGYPTTKEMDTYCKNRQAAGRGLVEVRRFDLTDQQRQTMHDLYKTILGRNVYSQAYRDYCYKPYKGTYYSDCSSSICRTAEKAGLSGYGLGQLNTAGMHYHLDKVPAAIENGIIKNPEILKVGDALMFKGSDPSRPLQIGHTEMVYEISDTKGSGIGEKTSTKGSTIELVKDGQIHCNNFTGANLKIDGDRGPKTKQAGIMALQIGLNKDYKTGLKIDGDCGDLTRGAMRGKCVKKGSKGYLVTALEILLMIKGYDPRGVECPGIFESGCDTSVRKYQKDHGLTVDGMAGYDTFTSLIS